MVNAPKGQTSLSGQGGQGATDNPARRIIRVFGERHTGTRAMTRMIAALAGVSAQYNPQASGPIIDLLGHAAQVEAAHTGGNAVASVLRDVAALARPPAACWKHARLEWDESFRVLSGVVLTQRNPYAWILALFARPHHQVCRRMGDFSTFITTPWLTIPRELMVAAVPSPAALWTVKHAAAQAFAARADIPTGFIVLESFLAEPVATLGAVLGALGQNAQGLKPVERSTKTDEPLKSVQARHAKEPWRNWLTAVQVRAINAHLDPVVMQAAGYKMENPEDFATELSAENAESLQEYLAIKQGNARSSDRE